MNKFDVYLSDGKNLWVYCEITDLINGNENFALVYADEEKKTPIYINMKNVLYIKEAPERKHKNLSDYRKT